MEKWFHNMFMEAYRKEFQKGKTTNHGQFKAKVDGIKKNLMDKLLDEMDTPRVEAPRGLLSLNWF